jgi:hypothetical protein
MLPVDLLTRIRSIIIRIIRIIRIIIRYVTSIWYSALVLIALVICKLDTERYCKWIVSSYRADGLGGKGRTPSPGSPANLKTVLGLRILGTLAQSLVSWHSSLFGRPLLCHIRRVDLPVNTWEVAQAA